MELVFKNDKFQDFFLGFKEELLVQYLDEVVGSRYWAYRKDLLEKEMADKSFFEIKVGEDVVGFGAYKEDDMGLKPGFTLYELFVQKGSRDLKQLHQIRSELINEIKARKKKYWYACVDNEDDKKINAYEGLGFKPILIDENYIYLSFNLEGI